VTTIKQIFKRFGMKAVLIDCFCKLMNKLVEFRYLRGMTLTLDSIDRKFLDAPPKHTGTRVAGDEIDSLAGSQTGISENFIRGAKQRGDWSYAYFDGQRVASYGWYSTQPVPINEDYSIHYSGEYTYMYKGFTDPDYRGEQLHAYGMGNALRLVTASGSLGLISYVEVDNFASLRSCERLGYRIFGSCWLIGLFGYRVALRSPACKRFDFGIQVST